MKSYFYNRSKTNLFLILSFLIPFIIRLIPEILMGKYVVGFDTSAYYIPIISKLITGNMSVLEFTSTAPLFYMLLGLLHSAGLPLVLALKIFSPALLGFLSVSIYFYSEKTLSFSARRSLLLALFSSLYFVTLRISWDLLRNELGLIFLFIFLVFFDLNKKPTYIRTLMIAFSMIMVALSEQFVAVLMFSIFAFTLIIEARKHDFFIIKNYLLSSIPSIIIFSLVVYAKFQTSDFSLFGHAFRGNFEGWILAPLGFNSYFEMVTGLSLFFFYCYLAIIPFVFLGAKNLNLQMRAWIIISGIIIISPIISPNLFLPGAYRWILMLIFPFSICSLGVITKMKSRKVLAAFLMIFVTLSASFIILPAEYALPYHATFVYYVPSSMLQNTVPLQDCPDVDNVLKWFNTTKNQNDVLLTHDAFNGWATTMVDDKHIICYGYSQPDELAQSLHQQGYSVKVIWWLPELGQHGQTSLSASFTELYQSGDIAIYYYGD